MGMPMVAKSDVTTGNNTYCSHTIQSDEIVFVFTAPYLNSEQDREGKPTPHQGFSQENAHEFVKKHGLAVRAVGIRVADAAEAFDIATRNGATGVQPPYTVNDEETKTSLTISEIKLFDDTVIRWVSGSYEGPGIPGYTRVKNFEGTYGLRRIDHCVSNVPNLFDATDYLTKSIGFHEFSEFTAEDVGTVDSGLNSMVMASNNEFVLLPVNEPTFGTKRKSQIQTYLENNNGAGVQHLALKTDDIFVTMKEMRKRSMIGGFEFMPQPSDSYYEKVPGRIGKDTLTEEQFKELKELGLLADRDDQGVCSKFSPSRSATGLQFSSRLSKELAATLTITARKRSSLQDVEVSERGISRNFSSLSKNSKKTSTNECGWKTKPISSKESYIRAAPLSAIIPFKENTRQTWAKISSSSTNHYTNSKPFIRQTYLQNFCN